MLAQAWRLLRRLRPALLLATGGFVALPPALAARALRIPVVVHEQTSVPGLANRVAGRFARRIALTFPLTGAELPKERTVLTGNPLRPELRGGSRAAACQRFGLEDAGPIVYVTGGALGSHRLNRDVGEALPRLLERCQVTQTLEDSCDSVLVTEPNVDSQTIGEQCMGGLVLLLLQGEVAERPEHPAFAILIPGLPELREALAEERLGAFGVTRKHSDPPEVRKGQ